MKFRFLKDFNYVLKTNEDRLLIEIRHLLPFSHKDFRTQAKFTKRKYNILRKTDQKIQS
jgi:hypothetical protein